MKRLWNRNVLWACVAAALGLLNVAPARGAYIPSLYNTGVDASHNTLPLYASDLNYDLIVSGDPNCPAGVDPVVLDFVGVWVNSNNAISHWIRPAYGDPAGGPNPNLAGICVNGTYVYRTTFTLATPSDVTTANITGQIAADDQGTTIKLNGNLVATPLANYASYVPFSIPSGSPFVLGLNTLDFEVQNLGGPPTGLRVEMSSIPEPASLGLFAAGGATLLLVARRRLR